MLDLRYFLFVFVLISGTNSAVIYAHQVEIPGHEGQCYDADQTIFYNYGDVMRSENTECSKETCLGYSSETGRIKIEILTCPLAKAGPGCKIVQDFSKPYPECCPKLVAETTDRFGSCATFKELDE